MVEMRFEQVTKVVNYVDIGAPNGQLFPCETQLWQARMKTGTCKNDVLQSKTTDRRPPLGDALILLLQLHTNSE